MQLKCIIEQIVGYTAKSAARSTLQPERILVLMDIISIHNPHLRNPLNADHNIYNFCEREHPLTGNEQLTGDYFAFEYIGHYPIMYLREFAALEELEQHIVSDSGLFNPFTTCLIAFEYGYIKEYTLFYKKYLWGRETEFKKENQWNNKNPFGVTYRTKRVQWLS